MRSCCVTRSLLPLLLLGTALPIVRAQAPAPPSAPLPLPPPPPLPRVVAVQGVGVGTVAEVFDCRDLETLLAERWCGNTDVEAARARTGDQAGEGSRLQQMARLLEVRLRQADAKAVLRSMGTGHLLVKAEQAHSAEVQAILRELRAPTLAAHAEVTLVRLPPTAAHVQVVRNGVVASVLVADEVSVGQVMKEAATSGGAIRNLPECTAISLAPFAFGSARRSPAGPTPPGSESGAARKTPAAAGPFDALQLECRALVVDRGHAVFLVRARCGDQQIGEHVVPLASGRGVLLTFAPEQGDSYCVWLRLAGCMPVAGEDGSSPSTASPAGK